MQARIKVNGSDTIIGTYDNDLAAALAYDQRARPLPTLTLTLALTLALTLTLAPTLAPTPSPNPNPKP